MEHWQDSQAVERNPEKVSGVWVFRGTRVPVAALFENLRGGMDRAVSGVVPRRRTVAG